MKILIASDVFPPNSGGSGWSAFHLARALAQRGHTIEIVLPKPNAPAFRARVYEGLSVVEIGYNASHVPGLRVYQRARALETTYTRYLAQRAREFDLIHAQHLLSISAATAAKAQVDIPVVSTVRDYWAVCLYGTLWRDNAICPICRGGEITKCLAQKYGSAAKFMQPAIPFVTSELRRRRDALGASDAIIAVSSHVADTLREIVPADKLHVIPNLIDVQDTQLRASNSFGEISGHLQSVTRDKPYAMFIGKLNTQKGADLLPEIVQKSGLEIPLVVAGEGELKADLARRNGIVMCGWVSNGVTLALLAGAQALLFPSRWAEPLARTLLEAQALGVPTVALNTGGSRDIIEGGFNGLLAANADEFSALLRALVQDAELRARLGKNAQRVAREKFSAGVIVPQMESVYANAVRT